MKGKVVKNACACSHSNMNSRRNMSMIDVAVISASSMQTKRCRSAAIPSTNLFHYQTQPSIYYSGAWFLLNSKPE